MMNQKIRVTKEFSFETAHALDGYNGKCKDIHGHSYQLQVTVLGTPVEDTLQSTCGMVIDFGDIKKLVKDKVLSQFDHRLLLRDDSRFKGIEKTDSRVRYVPYQPTCENMLLEIVSILKPEFTRKLSLFKVFLRETNTSYTEWCANDYEPETTNL